MVFIGAATALLAGLLLAIGCASARRSEPIRGPMLNPKPSVERGEVLFDRFCSRCHPGGEAGVGPALNNKPLPRFLIHFQIRHGLGAMPAFHRHVISSDQIRDLLDYVMALRRHKGKS